MQKRTPELDGLRGLAATLVVFEHLWPEQFFFGWTAVDVFFVLSGYLITGIILANGNKPGFIKTFYFRRSLRIWPIYYLTLIAALFFTTPEPGAATYYFFYLQNIPRYWSGQVPIWHEMVHTWTLAIEEQFYIFWPLLMSLFRLSRRVITAPLLTLLGSLIARYYWFSSDLLLSRCDGFAFGAVLVILHSNKKYKLIWCITCLAAIVALFLGIDKANLFRQYGFIDVTVSTLMSFFIVSLVVMLAGSKATFALRIRPLVYLGTISYGLYLYHYIIILRGYSLTIRLGIHKTFLEPVFFGILSLAAAVLSWHFIERPILRLKDKAGYQSSR